MTDDERISIALAALAEVTDADAIGPLVDASVPVPGVIDLRFATTQPGYTGWFWTVSTSAVDGVKPTVLELELLPGDGALVAPAWTPWEERLADWRRTHPGDADDEAEDGEEPDDEDADEDADGEDDLEEDELDETDLDDEPIDDVLDDEDLDGVEDDDESEDEDDGPEEPAAAVPAAAPVSTRDDPYGYLETVGSTPPRKR